MERWLLAAIVVLVVVGAWWASRRRRETRRAPARVQVDDFGLDPGPGNAALVFMRAHDLMSTAWMQALENAGTEYVRVDVDARPELARRYRVRRTPLVLAVRRQSGEVTAAYRDEPTPGDVSHVAALVAA